MNEYIQHQLTLVLHNIRSAYNVGSLFRSADAFGVERVLLTGYTPTPAPSGALYRSAAQKMIAKTALGAETFLSWKRYATWKEAAICLRQQGYLLVALEQSTKSLSLFHPPSELQKSKRIALILGNECRGLHWRILSQCDTILEIPQQGRKESLNVAVAGGIALAALTFCTRKP